MTKEQYDDIIVEYEQAINLVEAMLKNLVTALSKTVVIDSLETRVKTFESIEEKCNRKGYDFGDVREVRRHVRDIAGARITCQFKDQIMDVVDALRKTPGIAVDPDKTKDYLSEPKENGYQSYHLATYVQIYDPDKGIRSVPVEIQVRSKSQDLWASAEHIIHYKRMTADDDSMKQRFAHIAELLKQIDEEFIELRDFGSKSQEDTAP